MPVAAADPAPRHGPRLRRVLPLLLLLCLQVLVPPCAADSSGVTAVQTAQGSPSQAGVAGAAAAPVQAPRPEAQASAGRKDMTVFFSIGAVLDVLLVTAFLVWAVRQWRKTGKQEKQE